MTPNRTYIGNDKLIPGIVDDNLPGSILTFSRGEADR